MARDHTERPASGPGAEDPLFDRAWMTTVVPSAHTVRLEAADALLGFRVVVRQTVRCVE